MGLLAAFMSIVFITCHPGPAEHFAEFAKEIDGSYIYDVRSQVEGLDAADRKELAEKIVASCKQASIVITDLGYPFAVDLHEAFNTLSPEQEHWVYYDDPEPFVPGGYSFWADKAMAKATKVVFANAHLVQNPISEIGLGYFPVERGAKWALRRATEKQHLRSRLLQELQVEDKGQKIGVYLGGCNEVFFELAYPAFLKMVETEPSQWTLIYQKHPRAKNQVVDSLLLLVSTWPVEDIITAADAVFYYQTGMAPSVALAGIPMMQVGHEVYPDLLVRHRLCSTAEDPKEFSERLQTIRVIPGREVIYKALGFRKDWKEVLQRALNADAVLD